MATFRLHEDGAHGNFRAGKGYIEKSYKPSNLQGHRIPLSHITNGVVNTKRSRTSTEEEYSDSHLQVLLHSDNAVPLSADCLNLKSLDLVTAENKRYLEDEIKHNLPYEVTYTTEYALDIWKYLYEIEARLERPHPHYMSKQKFVNDDMRSILVDWLVSVADEYHISEQTIHLSVNYIDRFLSTMSVIREKFQLLGAAAMLLAIKVEEVNLLETSEFVYLTGKAYTTQQIGRMEQLLLKVLKFDINPPTMFTFIQQLCSTYNFDKKTSHLANYLSELILLEGNPYLQYRLSQLAVASVVLARIILSKKRPWFGNLEAFSGYSYAQLSPIISRQYQTFQESPLKEQQAIQKKYKTDKYFRVGTIPPKVLNFSE